MSYWVYDWMDAHGISTKEHAQLVLMNPVAVQDLRDRAAVVQSLAEVEAPNSILAGRGIDLSGHLDCYTFDCRRRQLDNLFRRVWHYFDFVVVEDNLTDPINEGWDDISPAKRNELITNEVELLLYLRSVRATDLILFRAKPDCCFQHLRQHAREHGLGGILDSESEWVHGLAEKAKIKHERIGANRIDYVFIHPEFEHYVWGEITLGKRINRVDAINNAIARDVMRRYLGHLNADIMAARYYELPLASSVRFHRQMIESSQTRSAESVSCELLLPVLNNIDVRTLIALRRDEQDSFNRFRCSLREAIEQSLKAATCSVGATEIAAKIRRELVDPELANIREKLKRAESQLRRTSGTAISLSFLVTACGVLAGVAAPTAVLAGSTVAANLVGNAARSFLEERRTIELSDMYFLWKAAPHAHAGQ
jgi:hypothetical protein